MKNIALPSVLILSFIFSSYVLCGNDHKQQVKTFISDSKNALRGITREQTIDTLSLKFIEDPNLLLWTAEEIVDPRTELGSGRALDFEGMVMRATLKAYGYPIPATSDEGLMGLKGGLRTVLRDFIDWHKHQKNSDSVKAALTRQRKLSPTDEQTKEVQRYVAKTGRRPKKLAKTLIGLGGSSEVKMHLSNKSFQAAQPIELSSLSKGDNQKALTASRVTGQVLSGASLGTKLAATGMLISGLATLGSVPIIGITGPIGMSLAGVSLITLVASAYFKYDYSKTLRFLKHLKERVVANSELEKAGLDQYATLDDIRKSKKFTSLESLLLKHGMSITRLSTRQAHRHSPSKRGVRALMKRIDVGKNPNLGFKSLHQALKELLTPSQHLDGSVQAKSKLQFYSIARSLAESSGPFDANEHIVFRAIMEALDITNPKPPHNKLDIMGRKQKYREAIVAALENHEELKELKIGLGRALGV